MTIRPESLSHPAHSDLQRPPTAVLKAAFQADDATHRLLFQHNPHCMWVFDTETLAFLDVNDAAIDCYGYTRAEFLSMTIADIRPSDEIPRLHDHLARVPKGIDRAGVWRHCHKNGRIIYMEIASHTVNFAGRRAEMVLAIEITDRIEAEHQIRAQLRELQRWQNVTLRREARIHALKMEVNALLREAGRAPRYADSEIALDEALKSHAI